MSAQKLAGKGRPTPTRKEAEAARKQRVSAPRTRKESAARSRELTRQNRLKVKEAMASGDDRYLPARDRGPARRYARDYVDARRTVGEYLLPAFFAVFVLALAMPAATASSASTYLWLGVIALMVADSIRIARGVRAGVRAELGDDAVKGVTSYAVMRALQMRRLRLPKPQRSPGDAR